jgi:hypothetical protein
MSMYQFVPAMVLAVYVGFQVRRVRCFGFWISDCSISSVVAVG